MKNSRPFNSLKWFTIPAHAALLLAAISAFAQSTSTPAGKPDEKKKEEEEILKLSPFQVKGTEDSGYFKKNTMVGTRSSELIVNIPQNIQIITSDLIRDIPTDTTAEVLKYGASGINERTPKLGDMFMRGFRVRGFLKDNIPYGGNINVPLYDVDRIEVVKGPAALVFGQSSATGGQVNYVTKAPTETPRSTAKATIGSHEFKRFEANTSGPLGLTGLSYRGTFATTDAGGPRKFDYNKDLFLGTTLLYKLSGTSSVQFDYSFSKKDEIVGQTGTDTTLKLARVPDDFTYFEPWVYGKSYYQFATLTYRAAITPSFQLQLVANFNRGNNDWDRVTPIGRPDPVTGLLQRNFQELFYDDRAVNQLTDFLHTFKTGMFEHKFSYGWAILHGISGPSPVTTVRIADLNINNPTYNTPKPNFNRAFGTKTRPLTGSTYIQEQLSFLDGKAIVVGGFRYNRFHQTALAEATNITTERNDQKGVKRFGAIFKPVPWASVYYNYSESFVFNTALIIGGPKDGQQQVPSVGESKEIGVKVETSDGRFFGSIAYYNLELTNVSVLVTLPAGSVDRFGNPFPANLGRLQEGKETNKGAFEADIGTSLNLPPGPMQAVLTMYHGNQKNAAGLLPNSVVNETWSVLVSQEFNKGPAKGLRVGGGAFHRSSTTGVGPLPGAVGSYIQPGYTNTKGFVSYSTGSYRFALNVDNLLDKKGMIEGGEDVFWILTNPGRTFRFSAEYRY